MVRLPTVADMVERIRNDRQVLGLRVYLLDAGLVGIFLVLLVLIFPKYVVARERAKEKEVKANLRVIQVALERYSVDAGGLYPVVLYGGHPTDTFATSSSAATSEFPGDVDWLLEAGYLNEYPQNPFRRGGRAPLTVDAKPLFTPGLDLPLDVNGRFILRANLWTTQGVGGIADRSQQWTVRQVGGPLGDRMWDVSEGQRHPPFVVHVMPPDGRGPDPCPLAQCTKPEYEDDHQCWLSAGNFYYYPSFTGVGNLGAYVTENEVPVWTRPIPGTVTGYKLSGYGMHSNPGQDVYQTYGDFPENSLGTIPPCLSPDCDNYYVGPDGRRDGVIEVRMMPTRDGAAIRAVGGNAW